MQYSAATLALFLLLQMALPVALRAQTKVAGTGNIYAASGMMVQVGRTVTNVAPKPTPVISPVILPRFWTKADTTKRAEYVIFAQELYKKVKYPVISLREQVEGVVYLNFRVGAGGQISEVTLKKSNLVWTGEATSKGKDALATEAIRAVKTLRFQPSTSVADTVTVLIRYGMQ